MYNLIFSFLLFIQTPPITVSRVVINGELTIFNKHNYPDTLTVVVNQGKDVYKITEVVYLKKTIFIKPFKKGKARIKISNTKLETLCTDELYIQ